MANNFEVLDEKLDNIKEQIVEIKNQLVGLHNKMFVGNGQKSVISRLDYAENKIKDLYNQRNRVIKHIWSTFGIVSIGLCSILGWLINKGFLKWMVNN